MFNRTIGRRIGSATLEATATDSRNDVISTAAVLAALVLGQATHLVLDGWMGLAVALFILYSGIGLIKKRWTLFWARRPAKSWHGTLPARC